MTVENVEVLKLSLHDVTVGHLVGYQGGRNILVFDQRYIAIGVMPAWIGWQRRSPINPMMSWSCWQLSIMHCLN